jgi:hypothetical protein
MKKGDLLQVKKAWYGTPDAGKHFYDHEVQQIQKTGFTQQTVDPCMHTRFNSEGKLEHVLIHHVDDMIVFSENNEKADKVERELSVNLPLKLLGRPILFLGIDFMYLPNGDLKLHQETFMTKFYSHTNSTVS